jgi:eukaryotic-like serine/threonine-protein kinase
VDKAVSMKRCKLCGLFVDPSLESCPSCDSGPEAWEDASLIEGRYAVEREIGRGGMGFIFKAVDVTLDRPVALKVVAESEVSSSLLARFQREARALAACHDPHVVQIYSFGHDGGLSFIAMELVQGEDLSQILLGYRSHKEHLPIRRSLAIIRLIAGALDRVHAVGIVHRDVKPENILIEHETGRPLLIDFGLSVRLVGSIRPSLGLGTPHYMAPEQIDLGPNQPSPPISARTDVYSLACTTFEMLTGQPPFDGARAEMVLVQHIASPAPPPSSVRQELLPFDPVLAKALAKDPGHRYRTAAELAAALDRAGQAWLATDPALPESPPLGASPNGNPVTRVLIVDDDDAFRRYAAKAAERAYGSALDLESAASGSEAIGRALLKPPDVILLDYSMPGLDGIETLTRLREIPACARARVLVISANVRDDQRWRFSLLGVSEFFEKPIALGALVAILRRIGGTPRGAPNPS